MNTGIFTCETGFERLIPFKPSVYHLLLSLRCCTLSRCCIGMTLLQAINSLRVLPRTLSRMSESGKMLSTAVPAAGPVETSIREKLSALLNPTSIIVTNDSWQHRHHSAMREQGGGNGETHFTVKVVSDKFDKKVGTILRAKRSSKLRDLPDNDAASSHDIFRSV
ncbi:hypothetical protein D9613_000394 [Agrocybe pediades]|uniref:Uncharacterized protein n=1 Tax=Agrocybe pediades TaxID=84607 RepID=A0A8H4R060_9AGAR|nr:hypothetical protein D9613_000394 [Agrocybe pediades]